MWFKVSLHQSSSVSPRGSERSTVSGLTEVVSFNTIQYNNFIKTSDKPQTNLQALNVKK